MREFLRNNGLSLALFALFLASILGQVFAGWRALGEELAIHGHLAPDLRTYLLSGHFLSATFENWESEFLQMGVYVLLTAWLIQKGSPESRAPTKARMSRVPQAPVFLGQSARVGCGFACTLTR